MRKMSAEELQEEVEKWKSKYQSQVGKMGAYKTKVQQEVLEREKMVKWKEEELKPHKDYEYTTERYLQIEGIVEGIKYILNIIDKALNDIENIK